jgi:prolyl-tRNA synthetase
VRTLRKVERIVREEMDRAGALELCMPTVQPAELWKESGRWTKYGPNCCVSRIGIERDFVYGPTHEEVITDIARRELRSYKQLPVNFYQIQYQVPRRDPAALRRHARPRIHHEGRLLLHTWTSQPGARVSRHVRRLFAHFHAHGLKFRAVQADGGSIGGDHPGISRPGGIRRGCHRILRRR